VLRRPSEPARVTGHVVLDQFHLSGFRVYQDLAQFLGSLEPGRVPSTTSFGDRYHCYLHMFSQDCWQLLGSGTK
jgi:hypothetical protein